MRTSLASGVTSSSVCGSALEKQPQHIESNRLRSRFSTMEDVTKCQQDANKMSSQWDPSKFSNFRNSCSSLRRSRNFHDRRWTRFLVKQKTSKAFFDPAVLEPSEAEPSWPLSSSASDLTIFCVKKSGSLRIGTKNTG